MRVIESIFVCSLLFISCKSDSRGSANTLSSNNESKSNVELRSKRIDELVKLNNESEKLKGQIEGIISSGDASFESRELVRKISTERLANDWKIILLMDEVGFDHIKDQNFLLSELRYLRKKLYALPEKYVQESFSSSDQIKHGDLLHKIGAKIMNLEASKLRGEF